MRYTKPSVLSSVKASKFVMGIPKFNPVADSNPVGDQGRNTASAYEADE